MSPFVLEGSSKNVLSVCNEFKLKLEAKKERRGLRDGEIQTACQSVCGTNAITFGDTNNQSSEVFKKWSDERAFGVVEEIHTLPSVQYLTKFEKTRCQI